MNETLVQGRKLKRNNLVNVCKKDYIAVLYRSPSQNRLEFDTFISNFGKMLGDIHSFDPDFSIIFGNFNVRSNNWWVGDTQTSEGSQIDSLTASYGFR